MDRILGEIVHLKEIKGMEWRQIGKSVGITPQAARRRYQRYKEQKEKKAIGDVDIREDAITQTNTTNTKELESKSARIKTLDQLIEACEIDLAEWVIDWHIVNKWEVGAKDDSGEIVISPLFQVKVKLVRKDPISLFPTITPIEVKELPVVVTKEVPSRHVNRVKRALVFGDAHVGFVRAEGGKLIPYHDRKAMNLVLQLLYEQDFHNIVILGDILDLPNFSDHFVRMPEFYNTAQASVIEATTWLKEIREAAPSADITYIEGNHEVRINKGLAKYIPAAYDLKPGDEIDLPALLSVERLLSLQKMSINMVGDYPDGEKWLGERIVCTHGNIARATSGGTTSAMVRDVGHTTVFGHIHRIELVARSIHSRRGVENIYSFSPGCLCSLDGLVPGVKAKNNWQQAMGEICYTDSEVLAITPLPIQNGRMMYRGVILEAADRNKEMDEIISVAK